LHRLTWMTAAPAATARACIRPARGPRWRA
jgi:hypothetical protein